MKKCLVVFISGLIGLSVSSCSIFHKKKVAKQESVLYPPPPDTARMQYLTTINGSDFLGKQSKFSAFVKGPEKIKYINKAFGVSVRNNKIYVCDPGIVAIEILDLNKKKFELFSPGGSGALKSPLSCFVDSNDYLYVADAGRRQVIIFDSLHNFKSRINDTGAFKPTDLMVYGDELWVCNPEKHSLYVYNKKTYEFKRAFGQYEQGDDGYLFSPFNFYITPDRVYVTDFGDFKIKVFDHEGKFLSSVGSYGTSLGQFVRPKGIACDHESNLYVVDAGFENTQIFNKQGQLLMFFGGPYKGPGDMWLPVRVTIDYDNTKYFKKYLEPGYDLKYLVFVSNQYGPDKVNVYGSIAPKK
jgi:sugar lactone lactonase YvrE